MRHGSLFSGIGGFDLAAEWMGWENVFHCEFNPFCQKILKHYWPDAKSYGDIKETDFTEWKGKVDIVSGGFPCQPHSIAGKQLASADDRDLWGECVRVLCEIRPKYALFENVTGLFISEHGKFFNRVLSDLAAIGFDVEWHTIPSCAIGAPHSRERVWIMANSNGEFYRKRREKGESRYGKSISATWHNWNNQPEMGGMDDGVPNRVDRIKALGNAIVPQVAYEIFKAIEQNN